ncbi:protein BIG GRAIN 1-like A [Apium graveolens]|uniref:protein BIG GRAIN 1-like A n=1 Tax=Apium graveolens TaxID=4045 RepID=UPI003D7AD3D8
MDKYRKHNYNSLPGDNRRYMSRGDRDQNPSFSSTLLDQIYRSIDDTNDHHVAADDDELVLYRETVSMMAMKKKKQYVHTIAETKDEANFQRIEKWMEKKKTRENIKNTREKSAASDHIYQRDIGKNYGSLMNLNSSWSSSDSSSGGLFSSEADSNYGVSSRSSTTTYRPKPIRTNTDSNKTPHVGKPSQESEGAVKRSKLKALKIYRDLKNVKQPISPGAKLASFLNSLFNTGGNVKKGKTSGAMSSNASPACSTSRSCLSKTPSTRGKLSDSGTKRMKKQSVEKSARDLMKNYERPVESEDDDDAASYASSDLFELDSLHNCGINVRGNYMEELPVYETTYLVAIADH